MMNITKRKLTCHECLHYAKFRCHAAGVIKKCGDKFPWRKLAKCPRDKWSTPDAEPRGGLLSG